MAEDNSRAIDKQPMYRRVADLHAATINRGFLATLGPEFLSLMYEAIDEGPDSVLLVSRDGDQIVGFVAGSLGMRPIYLRILRRWPRLFLALLPSVVSPRRLWRIVEIVRYSGDAASPVSLPQAELLSIGVDASFRRAGHAESLYQRLCEHFRNSGVAQFKIVVGSSLEPAHRFYRRMGAVSAARVEVHKGEASTVYVQTVITKGKRRSEALPAGRRVA